MWAASRIGLRGDWTGRWMEQLALAELLGSDFILVAHNASFDCWLDRPAKYGDLRRAVHFVLCACLGVAPETAVSYNQCLHYESPRETWPLDSWLFYG